MPRRIVDGEALWGSDKLAKVSPPKYRAEYANLLPLSLANGTFECNSSRVWSTVYSYNRPDISRGDVEKILSEFERVGLLFRWTDEGNKSWAYFVGIEKAGRLPAQCHRARYGVGANPPQDKLSAYLQKSGQAYSSSSVPIDTNDEVRSVPIGHNRSTSLPDGFSISDELRQWAKSKGYTRLEEHLEHFVGVAKAKGYKYANWDQAFKNAVRDNWAKLDRVPLSPQGKSVLERTKAQLEAQ